MGRSFPTRLVTKPKTVTNFRALAGQVPMTMTRHNFRQLFTAAFLAASVLTALAQAPAAKPEPGLLVRHSSGAAADTTTAANIWLHVAAGESPSPMLAPGAFNSVWSGAINADLRGDFMFRAEVLRGSLKLEIGGNTVLEATGDGSKPSDATKPIRLAKGANPLRVTFTSPASGDASLRLQWSEKGILWEPITSALLSYDPADAALAKSTLARSGRDLFLEHRCAKCHTPAPAATPAPELAMDAPAFDGIGSRRHFAWMAEWILDPKAQRAAAHMPRIFSGAKAREDAQATAAFLATLTGGANPPSLPNADDEARESGKKLVEVLHCAGCHNLPDTTETDAKKISLTHINAKFPPAHFAAFMKNPGEHYAWTHMPRFTLTDEEVGQIAAHLRSTAPMFKQAGPPTDAAIIARGKLLVQTTGCLNCHALKLENQHAPKPLAELAAAAFQKGCLAESPAPDSKAPFFAFNAAERAALQEFAATDRASLARHAPAEFAARQVKNLQCITCHGQLEGFPVIDVVGGKLTPEYLAKLLGGGVTAKVRPWIEHRMPAFPARSRPLAAGLAQSHGFAPVTPAEPPIQMDRVPVGKKLVSNDGGFSCISCHGVASMEPTQVFEAPGINLAFSGARLQKPWFLRWLRNPLRVDPQTKMPVYFDEEGKSPLTDVLGGDADAQLDSVWQYLRLGDKMPPPLPQQ
jgi:mono/diheme cytochrome c family protein